MRDAGYERLEWLIDWFKGVDSSDMIDKSLKDMLKLKVYEIPHALIQIGGGTGWDGMTYGKLLQDKDPTQFKIMIASLSNLQRLTSFTSLFLETVWLTMLLTS